MQQHFAGAAVKLDAPRQLTQWRLCRTVAEEVDSGLKPVFQCKLNLQGLADRPSKKATIAKHTRVLHTDS